MINNSIIQLGQQELSKKQHQLEQAHGMLLKHHEKTQELEYRQQKSVHQLREEQVIYTFLNHCLPHLLIFHFIPRSINNMIPSYKIKKITWNVLKKIYSVNTLWKLDNIQKV